MACYEPMLARKRAEGEKIIIFGKIKDLSEYDYEVIKSGTVFTIPCGKCIGCRLDYSRHWADRMVLEYEACKKAVFVTLTYADVSPDGQFQIPKNEFGIPQLRKDDMSEFMKSLRQKFIDNGKDVDIRFFGCGEYGEENHRPHMHLIIFGVDLNDLQGFSFSNGVLSDLECWTCNELGQLSYRSNFIESAWKERGIATVSDVSYETMAYVGRYSLKKAQGSQYPELNGLTKEFTNMSRRPGIGTPFLDKFPNVVGDVDTWYFKGKEIYWPKYLLEKYYSPMYYGDGYEEKLQEIKDFKSQLALNTFLNTYEHDERPYYQKQEFLLRQKESSVKKLKRGDVG